MSHGPHIHVYDLDRSMFKEEKDYLKGLLMSVEHHSEKEKEAVADFVNETLFEDKESSKDGFTFWNHRLGQDVKEYDDLIKLWYLYGKIIASELYCNVLLGADYKDTVFCINEHLWVLDREDSDNFKENLKVLKLKKKIREGREAESELKELEKEVDRLD